ncbi:MAG: alpha/beta fold hydrolase, partial [Sphingobacteriales bacterium]
MKQLLFAIALLTGIPAIGQEQSTLLTSTNMENISYPFPVSYIHLHIQGEPLQMAFMDVRPLKPNGKTVMLLHGKNFSGAYWKKTAEDLQQKGFRVIIPDQVGFGKSSKPERLQYTFQQLATNTKAIL